MNSYLSKQELQQLGLKSFGENVLISRKASIYKPEVISLGSNVRIDDFCILSGGNGIIIGNFIHIAAYASLFGGAGIVMEDYSGLSPRATLLTESDDFSGHSMVHPFFPLSLKPRYQSMKIILRRFAQVGISSTLMPGVELGEGVAIGAHSLVKKTCQPWSIHAGMPAIKMGERSKKLLDLERLFRPEDDT